LPNSAGYGNSPMPMSGSWVGENQREHPAPSPGCKVLCSLLSPLARNSTHPTQLKLFRIEQSASFGCRCSR